jgi:hypothetical protein
MYDDQDDEDIELVRQFADEMQDPTRVLDMQTLHSFKYRDLASDTPDEWRVALRMDVLHEGLQQPLVYIIKMDGRDARRLAMALMALALPEDE